MLGRELAYIWLMDDDAIPSETALERLLAAAAEQGPDSLAFISSYIVDSTGQRPQHSRNPPPISSDPSGVQRGCYPAAFCSFVCVLVDSRFAEMTWLPMKYFFWLWDDTEYTGRLARLAGDGLVCYRSKVAHLLTPDPLRGKKLRLAVRNAMWLIRFRSLGSPIGRERAKFGMRRIVLSDLLRTRADISEYGHFLAGSVLGVLTYPRRAHLTTSSNAAI